MRNATPVRAIRDARDRSTMRPFFTALHTFAVFSSVAIFAGCGGDAVSNVPISGTVSYKGTPLNGGEVRYVPTDPKTGRTAYGPISSDGSFTLTTTVSIQGVVPGEYKIVVIPEQQQATAAAGGPSSDPVKHPKDDPNLAKAREYTGIPAKYMDPASTDLRDTVDETHSGKVTLDLKDG